MSDHIDWPLPPDLEFIIIDHFLHDKPTLAACSLVCSRWLPPSRRHLFHAITIKPRKDLSPDRMADFLRALEDSDEGKPEWAIRMHIKKITLDGSFWEPDTVVPTLTCPLNFLCGVLSRLPQLASLCVIKLLMPDDLSQESDPPRFELDELIVHSCYSRSHDDPRHLFALLGTFSSIRSLALINWWAWMRNALPTSSLGAFSPPTLRSLTVERIHHVVASAIYALLAKSPSLTNGTLTHVSVVALECEDLRAFSDFAKIAGPAFREVELRVDADVVGHLDLLRVISLATCTALRSLVLCIDCLFDDSAFMVDQHADTTRWALHAYTQILYEHQSALSGLTAVRLEMQPVGSEMLAAFARVARDTYRAWGEDAVQGVPAEEAQQNRVVWVSLEDALCGFPALERVVLVLYERPKHNEILTEEGKVALRSALEGRLPRLWRSGIAQLVFETFVYRSG
ncbi:hypothetical protein LXA43DRAFT_1091930 [Ganoderma leucocontextum]|nr:hypothetical protein LXA43DRAFT_1091930 [Ganoderma leucocontextum]